MTDKNPKTLILASASPRRKQLLKRLGLEFKIIPANIDETVDIELPPEEVVKILALKKAENVASKINYPAIVIGSDTTVVIDDVSLGKPKDENDAFYMLNLLSGKTHSVITGIAIIDKQAQKTFIDYVISQVMFKELCEEDITKYIKTGEPLDKAGSYAIQGLASTFITGINGCYSNIVGLPIYELSQALKRFGIDILEINSKNQI